MLMTVVFVGVEVMGGYLAHSIAVMSDAAHLTSDALGVGISIVALKIAEKKSNDQYTYGYHRAEVLGALCSILFIWLVTVWLIYEATLRFFYPPKIDGEVMLIVAGLCLVFNLVQMSVLHSKDMHDFAHAPGQGCGHDHSHEHSHSHEEHDHSHGTCGSHGSCGKEHFKIDLDKNGSVNSDASDDDREDEEACHLNHTTTCATTVSGPSSRGCHHSHNHSHEHSHEHSHTHEHSHSHDKEPKKKRNLNVEAAYLHILGDVINSIGVLIASLMIYFTDGAWWYADPICTYVFACLVFYTTRITFAYCIQMLMESAPADFEIDLLRSKLGKIKQVLSVHDLHVWSLSDGKLAMSAHLTAIPGANQTKILKRCDKLLRSDFQLHHFSIQIECSDYLCGNDLHD